MSAQLASDAVREVESHIRERAAESPGMPNERDALEAILTRLGSPGTVARAYSLEMIMEEAAIGGRVVAVLRSLFHAASTSTAHFFVVLLILNGYLGGVSLIAMAVLKPIFPNNVGLWVHRGFSFGFQIPAPDATPLGGYWIIPLCLVLGLALLVFTHRTARAWVEGVRARLTARRAL